MHCRRIVRIAGQTARQGGEGDACEPKSASAVDLFRLVEEVARDLVLADVDGLLLRGAEQFLAQADLGLEVVDGRAEDDGLAAALAGHAWDHAGELVEALADGLAALLLRRDVVGLLLLLGQARLFRREGGGVAGGRKRVVHCEMALESWSGCCGVCSGRCCGRGKGCSTGGETGREGVVDKRALPLVEFGMAAHPCLGIPLKRDGATIAPHISTQ